MAPKWKEMPDDVVADTPIPPGDEDWIKGLRAWPSPDVASAEEMREKLRKWGTKPEDFKKSVLSRRWVDRLPWLADV